MRTDHLLIALILPAFGGILLTVLLLLTIGSWKRKYFPAGALTTSHAVALGGHLLSAATLAAATLPPIKDYLGLVSSAGSLSLSSGPLWGLLLTGAVAGGIAYLLATALGKLIAGSVFNGKAIAVELQENNLSCGLLYAITVLAFALAFILPLTVFIQGFIPMPSIPNIR